MIKNTTLLIFSLCIGLVQQAFGQDIPTNDSFTIRFDYGGLDSLTFPNKQDIQRIHNHLDQFAREHPAFFIDRIYFTMHAIPEAVNKLRYENASNRITNAINYDVRINAGFGQDFRKLDNTLDVVFEYAPRESISYIMDKLKQVNDVRYWNPTEDGFFLTEQGAIIYLQKNSAVLPPGFTAGSKIELLISEGIEPQQLISNGMHTTTDQGAFSPVYVNRFYARFDGKFVQPKRADAWLIIMPGEAMAASYRATPDTLTHFTADQNVSKFWTQSVKDPIILSGLLHLIENGDTSNLHNLRDIMDGDPKAFSELTKQQFNDVITSHIRDIEALLSSYSSVFSDAGLPSFAKVYNLAKDLFSQYTRPYSKENEIIGRVLNKTTSIVSHPLAVDQGLYELARKSLEVSLDELKSNHKELYKACKEVYRNEELEKKLTTLYESALIYRSINLLQKQGLFEGWQVMANYPKFMRGKADILGDEGLGLLMGWHNLFFPQEIYMNTASNRRDNQDSPRNLRERPMYAHVLNNGWNGLGRPIERKENPTLSVDFPCADYGKVFFYAKESGAVIIPRSFTTYHSFTRSLDVSTEGHIIAFFMANSRPVLSITAADFYNETWANFDFTPLPPRTMYTELTKLGKP
tara:strand:+ start:239 stop:2140 length:1902 start_codon:yes stop_codon:yes gene_type:complete